MTRLIDADALIENLEYDVELDTRALDDADLLLGMDRELVQFDKDCKQNVVDILKNAPTVDAEPVIRCMDCKWFGAWYCDLLHFGIVDINKYCAWAERKEE